MKISVVVPTYNEELAIAENLRQLVRALKVLGRDWELVPVNDGSTDGTLAIMREEANREPNIKIVSYEKNRGRGYAIKRGAEAATGEYIIITESDLNWGSEIIGRFVAELDKNDADIIIASPHMKGGRMENVPFLRWFLSYAGNIIFSLAMPGKFTMCTGMTRGYRREVFEALDLESNDKELHVEILYKALDLGFRAREIPAVLRWKKPAPGVQVRKSHFKFASISKHLFLSFSVRPFMLFGTIGFTLIGAGIISGLYLLNLSLSGIGVAGRPLMSFSVLAIVLGAQVLVFGFLAHQNRAIMRQIVRTQRMIKEIANKR